MTGDLNATFEHRPIKKGDEAATSPLNLEPNEGKAKRGCEEMRIHFFTAPSFVSFFTPGSKKQEEKGILPPFPQKSAF